MTKPTALAAPNDALTIWRAIDLILIGMVFYAVLASGILQIPGIVPFGQSIYDEYYLALLDGHLDIPARVVQLEGHYAPDGTTYLYHGVGPLLTRFALGWFWPFESVGMAQFSIWAWACLGTLCYHAAFLKATAREMEQLGDKGLALSRLLSLAVWFSSPGLLLAANTSFYHEPIALAYAATGAFVLIWANVAFDDWPLWRTAIPCAALAAVTLHARPNVAIGLYVACTLCLVFLAATSLRQSWLRAGLALAILGASGVGFLGLNVARFGDATETHGRYTKDSIQYGFVFWGYEDRDSARAEAFKEHGKFNVKRIPHNVAIYTLDLPTIQEYVDPLSEQVHTFARNTLAGDLGFIRIEKPFAGILFLWPLWLVFALWSFKAQRSVWTKLAIPLTGGLVLAFLTLSYGTITLRYRIDLWPALSLFVLAGLSAAMPRIAVTRNKAAWKWGLGICFLAGLAMSANVTGQLRQFRVSPEATSVWSLEECRQLASLRDFSTEQTDTICQPPRIAR
ncbi:hypothetical protein [uncultured Roseibium sp.]|uniref:hypothetical protein n=1 Tax=uncultured Roseibium sp. TaxID=1936171 RepID=UPI0026350B49|nr:hypothetical protein [uncultured Roseibium sp.]